MIIVLRVFDKSQMMLHAIELERERGTEFGHAPRAHPVKSLESPVIGQ